MARAADRPHSNRFRWGRRARLGQGDGVLGGGGARLVGTGTPPGLELAPGVAAMLGADPFAAVVVGADAVDEATLLVHLAKHPLAEEQRRIAQLLIGEIVVSTRGIDIRFCTNGIEQIVAELQPIEERHA